ncbi:anti-sigma factor family protein [Segetibacter aerophilus]|uniref:Uncharacterized protein n=1 Tax=Segetibacter aerophilus TaxID=670293 RepID=A0A512BHJ5_9BACT|nr:hypothetical protein [Segetibacter aerophilus]GEO11459.1 hypothetical protein SAE01_39550 [Segetibacter aerophilus]
MVINRHNYEEFFLLYVDNELNESDRAAVEKFVQENGDLAEELDMLRQAILPGEHVEFDQKELLYNKEEGISQDNYETYFLLAVDNELTPKENEEVEKFVLKHPELQGEYTLLNQTKLEPEEIIFEGKEKLYKKDEKVRPVILMNWMRMSAAAAVIGLIAISWFFTQNNNNAPATQLLTSTDKITNSTPARIAPTQPLVVDTSIEVITKKVPVKVESVAAATKVKTKKTSEPKPLANEMVAGNKKSQLQQVEAPQKVVDEIERPAPDRKSFEETIASAKISPNSNPPVVKEDADKIKLAAKSSLDQSSSLAAHAVYREIDSRENDEENTFYLGSAEINKTKLKGLFKKAASLFERKNSNNDGERTLKIAGFEIKSK